MNQSKSKNRIINLDLDKIAKQVANIEEIAKKYKWSFFYDEDTDSFYFSPKTIKTEFSLYSINSEFSIYVDKESNIGGVFIEYYTTNLTAHDKKFKLFKTAFTEKGEDMMIIPKKSEDKEILLSEVIKAELLAQLIKKPQSRVSVPA